MKAQRILVSTTNAVKVASGPISQLILNTSGAVYLGGPSVTAETGFLWYGTSAAPLVFPLLLLEGLWAIAVDPGTYIYVLQPGLL